ncbi:MAG: UDP-N-acetylmuramoyl-L-alanyl-D-glutamate--2,6-diaminopimelate ligase [Helicobacteraceae bacterium]|nr:UDP-N-acetylmuramoyl-L-alanyl-D-glutamate--2,6-diaminopimelate ligase [Helicobacteraceae bacterium]
MLYAAQSSAGYDFLTSDSRECNDKTAFVIDWYSAKYIDDARSNGAAAVLHAADLRRHFDTNMSIVGITGTNGKTTTAALIYSILLDLGHSVAMQGTRGFFINAKQSAEKHLTTPMLLENYARIDRAKKEGCDFFVSEVSSHAIAQQRLEGIPFALKIHTNITGDHLDFHGNIEEYRRVKNSFFADATPKWINRDDPLVLFNPANAQSYAIESAATLKLEAYSPKDGLNGVVRFGDERAIFSSALIGHFNLYNILAAIGAVKTLTDKSLQTICDQVENFGGVAGRMEVISRDPLIIVDFAHTPDGIDKALKALQPRKIVAVFGAGGDRDKSKRAAMGAAAAKHSKRVFLTSDNPRGEDPMSIIEQIKAGCQTHADLRIEADRRVAIGQAIASLEKDEVLVILGKGDEMFQEICGQYYPFDDRLVVREALREVA